MWNRFPFVNCRRSYREICAELILYVQDQGIIFGGSAEQTFGLFLPLQCVRLVSAKYKYVIIEKEGLHCDSP